MSISGCWAGQHVGSPLARLGKLEKVPLPPAPGCQVLTCQTGITSKLADLKDEQIQGCRWEGSRGGAKCIRRMSDPSRRGLPSTLT